MSLTSCRAAPPRNQLKRGGLYGFPAGMQEQNRGGRMVFAGGSRRGEGGEVNRL